MKYYPILIPVKEHSTRCPNKNALLLPILYKSLQKSGIVDKCVVLCDSMEILRAANQIGFNTWLEPQKQVYQRDKNNYINYISESVCKSEFESMVQWKLWYLSKSEKEKETLYNGIIFNPSWCFLAPATQPLKHPYFYNTIYLNEDEIQTLLKEDNCKVIVSTSLLTDRDIFNVCYSQSEGLFNDLVFDKDSSHRRGSLCYEQMNVDGTWYFINTNFLEDIVLNDTDKQNELFWNKSNIYGINNNEQPLIDIDTEDDMKKLLFIIEQLK